MIQMKTLHFISIAIIFKFIQCESCLESELCGSQVKFWIATTKNQNREWITESGLEHPKKRNTVGWKLQVEGDSVNCEEGEMCRLVALITPQCNGDNSSDYVSFGIGRYKLHKESVIWDEAKKICESEHSHLAVVDSLAEVNALKEIASKATTTYIFIGFDDKKKEKSHIDIFGKPVKKFWAPGQPDNANNNENCGTVTKEGLLNDFPCLSKVNFICEMPY